MKTKPISQWSAGEIMAALSAASLLLSTLYQYLYWKYFGLYYFGLAGIEDVIARSLESLAYIAFLTAILALGAKWAFRWERQTKFPKDEVVSGWIRVFLLVFGLYTAVLMAGIWFVIPFLHRYVVWNWLQLGEQEGLYLIALILFPLLLGAPLVLSATVKRLAPRPSERLALSLGLPAALVLTVLTAFHNAQLQFTRCRDMTDVVLRSADFVDGKAFPDRLGYALVGEIGNKLVLMEGRNSNILVVPLGQVRRWRIMQPTWRSKLTEPEFPRFRPKKVVHPASLTP